MILPRQEVVAEDLGKREGEVHDEACGLPLVPQHVSGPSCVPSSFLLKRHLRSLWVSCNPAYGTEHFSQPGTM